MRCLSHRFFRSKEEEEEAKEVSVDCLVRKCHWKRQVLDELSFFSEDDVLTQLSIQKFASMLQKCGEEGERLHVLRMHAFIAKSGLDTWGLLGNLLVSELGEAGRMDDAQRVFDKLIHRDDLSWNTLLTGYVKCGKLHHALHLYKQMQKVDLSYLDGHTFVTLLKACVKLKDVESGFQLHTGVAKAGFLEIDLFIGSSLVDMYAKCGFLSQARQVFDKLRVQNAVCWNALMVAYITHKHDEEALSLFNQMQFDGIPPDGASFVCALKACANIGAKDKVEEIHADIESKGVLTADRSIGNTLVAVYAKVGLLDKSRQVFDILPIRDVISWNVMITGYIEHGYGATAFECYERMQTEGITPSSVTFICALKACCSIGITEKGQEIHCEIERRGLFEEDLSLGNTLVDMYAQGGWIFRAQEVFEKLPKRDIVSWNVLMAGYAEHGHGKVALKHFVQMQHDHVVPDPVTLVCSLRACGQAGARDQGREIHAEIERRVCLKSNQYIGNALVDFYAKCGLLSIAQEIFDKLPVRDVISWNIMIAAYVEHGHYEEALQCLDDMHSEDIFPDSVTFVCGLRACNSDRVISRGGEMHAEIERKGLLGKDVTVGNALLDMYCKCCLLPKAQEVFDSIPFRDAISWNTLLAGYAEHGDGQDALEHLGLMQSQGVSPDAVTFVCGLKACGSIGAIDQGRKLHAEIERKGLLMTNYAIGSTLVDMYGKCGLVAKAQEVFDKLPVHDSVSWNALLAGYTEHGSAEETLNCLGQMRQAGVSLNVPVVVCSLKACGNIGATSEGQGLLREIQKKIFLERNYVVSSTLVGMCVKFGLLAQAQEVFDQLQVRDVVAWNVLMAGYAEHGQNEEALACLRQMQFECVAPDTVTYISSLKACSTMGANDKGQELHAEITMKGFFEREQTVGNTLLDMYAKCGSLAMAHGVFDKLRERDVVSWNTLIAGYAQFGQTETTLTTFERMLEQSVRPDVITFVIILNACSRSCLFQKSHAYFESMSKDYGIVPSIEHHSCVVDLFGRAGQLDEAAAVIEKMPLCPNLAVWHIVLGSCKRWGHTRFGNQAFKHALTLDDQESAAYA